MKRQTIKIIVNADDLGGSDAINRETFTLVDEGKITSCTMMSNGPKIADAIQKAKNYPDVSFGVHLNITSFHPICDNNKTLLLLDERGYFTKRPRSNYYSRELVEGIYSEWCMQIEKLQNSGISLSHMDSHTHVHTIPALFITLKKIQKKYCINKIRISKNIYSKDEPIESYILRILKRMWNFALKHYHSTKVTDGFTSLLSFVNADSLSYNNMRSIELMVHPGSNQKQYINEIEFLRGNWQSSIDQELFFVSYHDI